MQMADDQPAHPLNTAGQNNRFGFVEDMGSPRDILGQIANAFQIMTDTVSGDGGAQIGRHGLAQGDDANDPLFDLPLHLIHAAIPVNY